MGIAKKYAPCWVVALPLVLGGCDRKVALLEATNLRQEVVHPTNEHVIKVDVAMSPDDYERVAEMDTILVYTDCSGPPPGAYYGSYGIIDKALLTTFRGKPAQLVTFNLFSTNVPSEVPSELRAIRCVYLKVSRGYGFVGYHSDLIRINAS